MKNVQSGKNLERKTNTQAEQIPHGICSTPGVSSCGQVFGQNLGPIVVFLVPNNAWGLSEFGVESHKLADSQLFLLCVERQHIWRRVTG